MQVAIGREMPRDGGQQVGRRRDTFEMAIFVMHHYHRHIGPAQHFQRVHRIDLVWNHLHAAHQRPQVKPFSTEQRRHDVARLHHPDNILDRSTPHRQTGVRCFEQPRADGLLIRADVDPVDVHARRHDFAHRPVGQPHHA